MTGGWPPRRNFRLPWASAAHIGSEVDEELSFHLDMRAEELAAEGLTPSAARRQAEEEFGDLGRTRSSLRKTALAQERSRQRGNRFATWTNDLRLGARMLWKAPRFALTAILTLGIGIGTATAVVSLSEALVFRPIPVHDPGRVVVLMGATPDGRFNNFPLLLDDARAFSQRARSMERVAFFSSAGAHPVPIRDGESVIRMNRSLVSGGFFQLLGAAPHLGRTLLPEDDEVGAPPVVVLSYRAWQRYFRSDPGVLERSLVMHGTGVAHRIVGVMPRGLDYPVATDFFAAVLPNSPPIQGDQPYAELSVLGRLGGNASIRDAGAELTAYFSRPEAPAWSREVRGDARTLTEAMVGDIRPILLAFSVAAALLLIVACFNVGNLLLVRGLDRTREMAVRSALGADRGRIVRQLLVESTLLAVAGGVVGMFVAMAAVRTFRLMVPAATQRFQEVGSGALIFGVALAITGVATLLAGLMPALLSASVPARALLHSGSREVGPGRLFRLGTQGLVIGQVAMALLSLSVAGLLVQSVMRMQRVELALDPPGLIVAELAMPNEGFGDSEAQLAFMREVLPRIEAIPGVEAVSPVLSAPFAGAAISAQIPAEGQPEEDASGNPIVDLEPVVPGHFATLGTPLLRGREFSDTDVAGAPGVAVVSESAAAHYWPDADPLGKRLLWGGGDPVTVIGIVPDMRYRNLRDPRPAVYLPLRQTTFPVAASNLVLRTSLSPIQLIPALERAIHEVDPGVAAVTVASFDSYLDQQLAEPRLYALLLTAFATIALLLASLGLYGTMGTMVRQRTREMGLRLALGAEGADLTRIFLIRGVNLALAGAAAGLALALAVNHLLRGLLFEIEPVDFPTLAIVSALLLVVSSIATFLPARKGAQSDPMSALRGA